MSLCRYVKNLHSIFTKISKVLFMYYYPILKVTSINDLPPPIIELGPTNQTLAMHSDALLHCQARGTPAPMIKWFKNGNLLDMRSEVRLKVINQGTLSIKGIKVKFFLFRFV